MIIGILLGISLTVNLTSALIIFTSNMGILRENLATGAVIGVGQMSSYAVITLIISLITTFALMLYLRKPKY